MSKLTMLMVLGVLGFCFQNVKAEVVVRERHIENIDFSGVHTICTSINYKMYLVVSMGNFELTANRGLELPERECYKRKLALDDYFYNVSEGKMEITEIEITGETCDRDRICTPDNPVYQTRLTLQVGDEKLTGYKKEKEQKPSSPIRRNPHEGCSYYGKLGGGWVCN